MKPRPRRQRGFALLIVLWSLALLALLGTHVTSAGRTEVRIARNLRDAAQAEAAADGAIHEAVFRLQDRSERRWRTDGQTRELRTDTATIAVRIDDPRGLVNPNSAPAGLLAALIREVGGEPRGAVGIAAAIFDWRAPGERASPEGAKTPHYVAAGSAFGPTGHAFAHLAELNAVLGMTPELLAALRPHLSLYNFGPVDPSRTNPTIARALQAAGVGQPALNDLGPILLVRAEAMLASGARFTRRATLLLLPARDGRAFRILDWDSGDG